MEYISHFAQHYSHILTGLILFSVGSEVVGHVVLASTSGSSCGAICKFLKMQCVNQNIRNCLLNIHQYQQMVEYEDTVSIFSVEQGEVSPC